MLLDLKFNILLYFKMYNVFNEIFYFLNKFDWFYGSLYLFFFLDKVNIKNVQIIFYRSDFRLIKNVFFKVNSVVLMFRGSTFESFGSLVNVGISFVDFLSVKMFFIFLLLFQ